MGLGFGQRAGDQRPADAARAERRLDGERVPEQQRFVDLTDADRGKAAPSRS